MSVSTILIILVVLLLLGGGGWGYRSGAYNGSVFGGGLLGLVVVLVLVFWLLGRV